ncbi:hypothetical protein ACLBWS_05930 [Brucellaceae bacterium D45D]
MRTNLKIAQIAVELSDGSLGVIVLKPDYMQMLLPMIEALSEGPIQVLPVPGMKMVSAKEVFHHGE